MWDYKDKVCSVATSSLTSLESSARRDTVVAKWTLLSNKGRPNDSKGPDYFIITSPVISDDEDRKTVPSSIGSSSSMRR